MKNRLLLKVIVCCMLLPLIGSMALAVEEVNTISESAAVIATVDGETIKTMPVNDENYLF